ncbi:hypothetical protein GCM10008969_58350 [Pseudomonas veronii subsp. inensis]|uniref:hypothetical protein n=1 Tax=Pseudomonas veronii TaxID=76761 RepID=UPI0031F9F6FD
MDDEGDFKKARGFLLTYSAFVLALLYFGADLTQFKLMGNEVQLHQHTKSAWLVLAVVNIYFWFRCYQRVPRLGLYFDGPMNDLYDRALVWVAVKLKKRALNKQAQEHYAENYTPPAVMQIHFYGGEATARDTLEEDSRHNGDEASELHQISRAARTKMRLHTGYTLDHDGQGHHLPGYSHLDYEPRAFITWPVKAFVIARGAFVTPWFTDHIAPLVLGGISTLLALWRWCDVNFFSTTLSHGALICT